MSLTAARWSGGAALIALGAFALPAAAQPSGEAESSEEKEICASTFERGQELELAGRLQAARAAFERCAAATCPAVLSPLCTAAAQRLDTAIPSIVISVRGGGNGGVDSGGASADVRVLLDGELRAERLDGTAIPLDPGSHHLRVERHGSPPVERDLVIRAGERNHPIEVSFPEPRPSGPKPTPAPTATPAAAAKTPAEAPPGPWSKAPAIAALAVGGVGIAVGAVAGGLALANKLDLDGACPTKATCDPVRVGQIAAMKEQSMISTVGFVTGAAGLALGAVLFVIAVRAPTSAKVGSAKAGAAGVSVALGPGSLGLRGTF